MQSNYKRLGDYIREVKVKNTDLKASLLLGINIDKFFMPSVANVVGTDMANYRLVNKNQFACNRMHVGRDYRIPIALSKRDNPFMVSPAYDVFEIIDSSFLLPEYLMMWFSRKEFDRNAWFHTDADVRGGLPWKLFCDLKLPIPSPEKQLEIVREYNVIQRKIKLNNQLISKLEETAQAIYKKWFVDFEFPDENGLPYKSSGGEMVESELGEIPKNFDVKSISQLCNISSSRRIFEYEYTSDGVPFYRGKEITLKKNGETIEEPIFISHKRYNELVKLSGKPLKGDILMTAVGTIGSTYLVCYEDFYFKDGNVIWFRKFVNDQIGIFLYDFMQSKAFKNLINEITIGSTQSAITITTFGNQLIVYPNRKLLIQYTNISILLNDILQTKKTLKAKLKSLRRLLLAKMTKVEMEKDFA